MDILLWQMQENLLLALPILISRTMLCVNGLSIELDLLLLEHIHISKNLADCFTKKLPHVLFHHHECYSLLGATTEGRLEGTRNLPKKVHGPKP